jgi:hypothetical protein
VWRGEKVVAVRVEHRLVNITSHVVSFEGSVGLIGLCACGELISAEGYRTHEVTIALRDAWRGHVDAALTDVSE